MIKFKVKLWHIIPEEACGDLLKKYESLKYDYYTCIFFDNADEMYAWYDKKYGKEDKMEHNYTGLCKYDSKVYFMDGEFYGHCRNCGYILYCFNEYGADVLSHEVAHAVTFYFEYRIPDRKFVFTSTEENNYNELFCYMVGRLVRQINDKYYEILNKQKEQV